MMRNIVGSATTIALLAIGLTFTPPVNAGGKHRCGCDACQAAVVCEPQYQTVQRTVMVPEMSVETRQIPVTVHKPEVRQTTVTVMREVTELKQIPRTYTVMETQQRSRVENYVKCTPVWNNVERQVTEMIPEEQIRQGMRQVCRQVQVQETRVVCKDLGHWEERPVVVSSPCDSCGCRRGCRSRCRGCGGCAAACGGCGSGEAPTVALCRVWVPNIVQEQVPVLVWRSQLVDEPYQFRVTVCKPQVRVVIDRVCEIKREPMSRTINFNVVVPKQMTKVEDVKVVRCVPEQQQRDITVMVPHVVLKDVQVRVCRMVPKVITCQVPIYQDYGCWDSCCSP